MNTLNRLRWKCRRGMLELDLVLQQFLERDYAALDASSQQAFEALLESGDEELWAMISGEAATGIPGCDAVIGKLRAC
jgi:antitoxin CptB